MLTTDGPADWYTETTCSSNGTMIRGCCWGSTVGGGAEVGVLGSVALGGGVNRGRIPQAVRSSQSNIKLAMLLRLNCCSIICISSVNIKLIQNHPISCKSGHNLRPVHRSTRGKNTTHGQVPKLLYSQSFRRLKLFSLSNEQG
jgi:hypothetical protein